MRDRRAGRTFNYQRKPGLLAEGLVNWRGQPQNLWNAAEKAEIKRNARVARELRPALPAELPLDDQRRLVHGYCCWLKDEFGIASHYAIHAPTFHKKSDSQQLWAGQDVEEGRHAYMNALKDPALTNRNFHAHILITTRDVDPISGDFGKKVRVLDDIVDGPQQILLMRQEWECRTNAALKKIGNDARIDLRSYKGMAADGDAPEGLASQEHLGPQKTERSRRSAENVGGPLPLDALERETCQDHNEELWASWRRLERFQREKAELIAAQREDDRKARSKEEKSCIASARTEAALAEAVEAATTIDVISLSAAMLSEIRDWAKSSQTAWTTEKVSRSVQSMSAKPFGCADLDADQFLEEIKVFQTAESTEELDADSLNTQRRVSDNDIQEAETRGEPCQPSKDADDPMAQAITWSQSDAPLPSSDTLERDRQNLQDEDADDFDNDDGTGGCSGRIPTDRFDEQIDPESYFSPQAKEPKTPRIRVIRKERDRGARVRDN